jgi:hypothetical protein
MIIPGFRIVDGSNSIHILFENILHIWFKPTNSSVINSNVRFVWLSVSIFRGKSAYRTQVTGSERALLKRSLMHVNSLTKFTCSVLACLSLCNM